MTTITLEGNEINTAGYLPGAGSKAPDFTLTNAELAEMSLSDFSGKNIIMNIFPSIDTGICAESTRKFNSAAESLNNTVVLCISADLPFASARLCDAENLDQVITLSTFRNPAFGDNYGVRMIDGPIAGLMSRAVLVIDTDGTVVYSQQVPEIKQEPDYDAALAHIQAVS